MFKPFLKIRDKKGVALISTYMIMAVLLAFSGLIFDISNWQNKTTNTFKRQLQATDIAEAGLDRALVWLRAQAIPPTGNSTNPWGGAQNLGNPPIGSYSVTITDLGSPGGAPNVKRYRINSTSTVGGITQTLTNYLQTDNYARYIWFTDREQFGGTNVWFWDQDHLNGPAHSNGHFNIKGNPVFDGEVRSVDNYIRYYNNGNNINSSNLSNPPFDVPVFGGTVTLGSDSTNMPTQALNLRSASTSGGLRLSGNSTVVLNSNGTMNVTNAAKGWNNHNTALPANGALFVSSGTLTISGTLNGRLTAGASRDIIIPNNILYASDPRVNPASTDTLGLISEEDIMISSGAPSNLEIDASIMALNTSFMMENWWVGPAKGTLTVFGGIIQDERGPVGTFSGSTKMSGYSKNYNYDARLLNTPPPFVPTTGDYITLEWEN